MSLLKWVQLYCRQGMVNKNYNIFSSPFLLLACICIDRDRFMNLLVRPHIRMSTRVTRCVVRVFLFRIIIFYWRINTFLLETWIRFQYCRWSEWTSRNLLDCMHESKFCLFIYYYFFIESWKFALTKNILLFFLYMRRMSLDYVDFNF